MAKTTCRIVLQEDKSYAVEMDVGRSVRVIKGFATADDARGWARRAHLQEMSGAGESEHPQRRETGPAKPD
jgi:hypothetical protein